MAKTGYGLGDTVVHCAKMSEVDGGMVFICISGVSAQLVISILSGMIA